MHRLQIRSRAAIAGAVIALMVLGVVPATVSAATRPITIEVYIGNHCIIGRASDNANVALTLKTSDGTTKVHRNTTASAVGTWSICNLGGNVVEIGDRIRVADGNSVHHLTVPLLTAFGSRDRDSYKGRGPAGEYIKLICQFSNGFEPCTRTWRIRVSSEGKWSLRPGWDVRGGETADAQWKSPAGDIVRARATPAFLIVRIGSARVTGATRSGAHAVVVLKRGPALNIRAMANPESNPVDGRFSGRLRSQAGNKVLVRAGDLISSDISSEVEWFVPDIQATGDSSTQHVTGQCEYEDPSGAQSGDFEILAFRNGAFVSSSSITDGVDENGFFDVEMEFQAGDRLLVRCGMGGGDMAEKFFTAV